MASSIRDDRLKSEAAKKFEVIKDIQQTKIKYEFRIETF